MSGGSWEYCYFRIEEIADRLQESTSPLRRAFGEHMQLCAKAMHDIEWSDSGDTGPGDWRAAVQTALGDASSEKELKEIKKELERIRNGLSDLL